MLHLLDIRWLIMQDIFSDPDCVVWALFWPSLKIWIKDEILCRDGAISLLQYLLYIDIILVNWEENKWRENMILR